MLERWLQAALDEAGGTGVDPGLLGPDAVTVLLNLARDAAHGVARPAAPLATFAVGVAVGQGGGTLDDLRARVERVVAAANAWAEANPPGSADDGPASGP